MLRVTLEQIDKSLYNTKQRITIPESYFEIGRSDNCELVLPESMDYISLRHMSIMIKGQNVILEHLGSNPSYKNGELIAGSTHIVNGDIVQLTTLGPQYKFSIIDEDAQSSIVKFFRSRNVIWFYFALLIWAALSILYFLF